MKWAAAVVLVLLAVAVATMVRIVPNGSLGGSSQSQPVNDGAGQLAIPVAGVRADQLRNSWQDSRDGGARAHDAIDIAAPGGTPVLAAMAGRVEKQHESPAGGTTIYVRSGDGRWIGYYAHLAAYAPGLAEGSVVKRGQRIGFVGDTGNAGSGNTHLHFALYRMARGDPWYRGTPVNPYPLLVGNAVPR